MSLTGGGDHRISRLVDVSGEHCTLRGGELGTIVAIRVDNESLLV